VRARQFDDFERADMVGQSGRDICCMSSADIIVVRQQNHIGDALSGNNQCLDKLFSRPFAAEIPAPHRR
jgi:hypothetical protein